MPPPRHVLLADVTEMPATMSTIDSLARLRLEWQRLGFDLVLEKPSDELRELVRFCGLALFFRESRDSGDLVAP